VRKFDEYATIESCHHWREMDNSDSKYVGFNTMHTIREKGEVMLEPEGASIVNLPNLPSPHFVLAFFVSSFSLSSGDHFSLNPDPHDRALAPR
jgi:hypothetical protein